jgi:putative membrane protein
MIKPIHPGILFLAAALGAVPAFAASPDATFAMKAAQGGLAEVKTAQLAEKKSKNASVLAFARQMISDHTPNNKKLATIMRSEGLTVPTSVGAKHEASMTKLQSLSGAAFNGSYLKSEVTDHQEMATLLQDEIANGKDPKLVAYAKSTLPVVQAHLSMAQSDVKGGSSPSSSTSSSK